MGSQGSKYSSPCSSATATHRAHCDSTAQEKDESSTPAGIAALVSISSAVLMLLLPDPPSLPGPCPRARVRPQHRPGSRCAGAALALDWGLCAAGAARTALKQSPAPSPLQPLCFTSSSPLCAPLQPQKGPAQGSGSSCAEEGRLPLEQRCGVTAGLWHTGTVSCSVHPGEEAAAAAAVPGPWNHQPAGSSLGTPVTASTKQSRG